MDVLGNKPRYLFEAIEKLALVNHKMAFISGPRQVGKTTFAKSMARQIASRSVYFNWDDKNFRRQWAKDPAATLSPGKDSIELAIFDEIHKAKLWKRDLKGAYDLHGDQCQIIVTGSARLNVFKKGGDSLLGRYFPFRLHPLSLGELTNSGSQDDPKIFLERIFVPAVPTSQHRGIYEQLFQFGGFPDPYSKASKQYLNVWHQERVEKLIREDLRDLSRIPELSRLEMLAALIPEKVGSLLSIASLREDLEVAHNTVKNWMQYLEQLYYFFTIRPYARGVTRSLKKEPKIYLWDWSELQDSGCRFENLVASALLKACDFWTDIGHEVHQVHFLRDKEKREVDFLITQKNRPLVSIEAKLADTALGCNYLHFCKNIGLKHHIQIVHSPGIWSLRSVSGVNVLTASAEYALLFLP